MITLLWISLAFFSTALVFLMVEEWIKALLSRSNVPREAEQECEAEVK